MMLKKHLKHLFTLVLTFLMFASCSSSDNSDAPIDEEETIDDDNKDDDSMSDEIDISSILDLFDGTGLSYELTDDSVIFTTADLPNHKSPYWDASNELYGIYNGNNPDFRLNPNSSLCQR